MKPLADGATAVALFNPGAQPAKVHVRWADLRLPARAVVRDLWRQAELGETAGYSGTVPSHGTVLLRLAAGSLHC